MNYITILHETIVRELIIDAIIFNFNSIDKLDTNNAYRTMTGSYPSIATTRLAERQQITCLNSSTIIWLDNSTIKRTQTKATLTQRGSRETRNQRLL